MPDSKSSRGRAQDRWRFAGGPELDAGGETHKAGTSRSKVRTAIKRVGTSRIKVEKVVVR